MIKMQNNQEAEFIRKLNEGEELAFIARGDSMLPLYPDQTSFFLKKVSADDLCIGDLVLFKRDEQLILHRLVKLQKTGVEKFVTKGDRLRHMDPPWIAQELLAKAVAVVKHGNAVDLSGRYKKFESYLIALISPMAGKIILLLKK